MLVNTCEKETIRMSVNTYEEKRDKIGILFTLSTTLWLANPHWHVQLPTMLTFILNVSYCQPVTKLAVSICKSQQNEQIFSYLGHGQSTWGKKSKKNKI